MSLDVYLSTPACAHCGRGPSIVYTANITHNLRRMADAAGIYQPLWRPEEIGATRAKHLLERLRAGFVWLKANKAEARKHDSPNGWGLYDHFVPFVENYLAACEANPEAEVSVSR